MKQEAFFIYTHDHLQNAVKSSNRQSNMYNGYFSANTGEMLMKSYDHGSLVKFYHVCIK